MSDKNPYLDLMEDDEPKAKPRPKQVEKPKEKPQENPFDLSAPRIAPDWATVSGNAPIPSQDEPVLLNPTDKEDSSHSAYLDLMDDSDHEPGFPYGPAGAALAPGLKASRNAGSLAESLTGAPAGSVAEISDLMSQSKPVMTPALAAQQAAEARIPQVPPVPPAPVEAQLPQSGGQKWLENYANMERPEFTGGVPEAAQTHQRSKPQGKVTSQLYKKFGNKPLNIAGQAAQTALSEDEALMRVRQALYQHQMHKVAADKAKLAAAERAVQVGKETQSAAQASRLSQPLSTISKALGVAGLGLGGYDAYRRFNEGDKTGAGLAAGATAVGAAVPIAGPLSAAALGLYDDPEARKKFVESMKPGGAWQQRMEGRFGLD